jgi:dephospho-CoA kinase
MSSQLKLVGVAGTAGAGKNTVAEMLAEIFNLQDLNTSEMVRAITRKVYHLPPDFSPVRDQLYIVANYLRNIDPALLVKLCILEGQALELKGGVISGLRSMGEADAVRAAGGIIVCIDADAQVRYRRIHGRNRDAETKKTFEEFMQQDEYENRGLSDTGPGRGISHIIESADVVIKNAGSLEELKQRLEAQVGPLLDRQ